MSKKSKQIIAVKKAKPKKAPNVKFGVPKQLVSQVCGLSDPFCEHAGGAKYPDSSSIKTLPYSRRLRFTIGTDAGGYANVVLNPQYSYSPWANNNVYAANVVTSFSNFAAYATIAGVSSYRIVSQGFVIRHIVSPLNSAGMIYVRLYGSENGASFGPIDTTTYNASSVGNIAVQDAREVAVVFPHTSQMPQVFYPVSSDSASVGSTIAHGFGFATISLAGAIPSTAILEVELVTHYELVFEDSSDLAQVSTPSHAANAMLTGATAVVTSTLRPIVHEGVSQFGKLIVSKAVAAAGSYLGGPVGGAVASRLAHMAALTVD